MSLTTEAMPLPPVDEDVIGSTQEPQGGDATFEGDLPDDIHALVCVNVKHKRTPNKFKQGELRDQAVFLLAAKGHEAQGELAWYTSFSLHEKSKLPGTYKAFGLPIPPAGTPIKRSDFVGRSCRALTEMKPSKDGTKRFPRIEKLLPAA